MKYEIFPGVKPEPNQLIWWVNAQAKEQLGYWLGGTEFVQSDGVRKGYYVKYWRVALPEDEQLVTWSPNQTKIENLAEPKPEKRKYTKRQPKEPKPEKVKGKRGRPKKVQL